MKFSGKNISGGRNSRCEGSVVGACGGGVRTSNRTRVVGAERGLDLVGTGKDFIFYSFCVVHCRRVTNLPYVLLAAVFRIDSRWGIAWT